MDTILATVAMDIPMSTTPRADQKDVYVGDAADKVLIVATREAEEDTIRAVR